MPERFPSQSSARLCKVSEIFWDFGGLFGGGGYGALPVSEISKYHAEVRRRLRSVDFSRMNSSSRRASPQARTLSKCFAPGNLLHLGLRPGIAPVRVHIKKGNTKALVRWGGEWKYKKKLFAKLFLKNKFIRFKEKVLAHLLSHITCSYDYWNTFKKLSDLLKYAFFSCFFS